MELVILTRLLDSVILIDHLNGVDKATDFLSSLPTNETAISVITRAEVLVGVDSESSFRTKRLLDRYQLLVIDGPISGSSQPNGCDIIYREGKRILEIFMEDASLWKLKALSPPNVNTPLCPVGIGATIATPAYLKSALQKC